MNLKIAVLSHYGHGIQTMEQAVKCIHAIEQSYNHHFSITKLQSLKREDSFWLEADTLLACKKSDAILSSFSITENAFYKHQNESAISLINALDCHASVCPILEFPKPIALNTHYAGKKVDFVLFSSLKSGYYKKSENLNNSTSDHYLSNTQGIHQLFHLAFKTAKNRKQNLVVLKPNGPNKLALWEKTLGEISASYPMVNISLINHAALNHMMILEPEKLDCIFADNIQAAAIQASCIALSGLKNILPIAHMGVGVNIFEPLHGEIPVNLNKEPNPIAAIYSVALMLSRFGLQEEARAIQLAINKACERLLFSKDETLPEHVKCEQLGDFIAAAIIDAEDIGIVNDENVDLGKSTII